LEDGEGTVDVTFLVEKNTPGQRTGLHSLLVENMEDIYEMSDLLKKDSDILDFNLSLTLSTVHIVLDIDEAFDCKICPRLYQGLPPNYIKGSIPESILSQSMLPTSTPCSKLCASPLKYSERSSPFSGLSFKISMSPKLLFSNILVGVMVGSDSTGT
jgi:hypothetical protein